MTLSLLPRGLILAGFSLKFILIKKILYFQSDRENSGFFNTKSTKGTIFKGITEKPQDIKKTVAGFFCS